MQEFQLSNYSPCNSYYASVSESVTSFRLRIWESLSSNLIIDTIGQENQTITCISWNQTKTIALGTASGEIILFSVPQKQFISKLLAKSKVTDFIFGNSATAFSICSDGLLQCWDLNTLKCTSSIQNGLGFKLALNHQSSVLAIAGNQIKLYLVKDLSCIHTFTGHSTPVLQLLFSADDKFCLSLAEQERSISVWNCQDLTKQNVNQLLSCDAQLQKIHISNEEKVLAVDEFGIIHFWEIQTTKGKKRKTQIAKNPIGTLKVLHMQDPSLVLPIYSAIFLQDQILISRGSIVKLCFEKLEFLDSNGIINVESIVQRSPTNNLNVSESEKRVVDPFNIVVKSDAQFQMSKINNLDTELSIGEKLKDITIAENDTTTQKINSVVSLHKMLSQAIVSEDVELLERCLGVRNQKMISSTVQRLTSTLVLGLLQQVVTRLQSNPKRGMHLIEWIRAALIFHSSYLMSMPDLVEKLGSLYRSLETRVNSFEKMLKLSGRLDVIISQSAAREKVRDEQEAAAIYNESDEEDMESVEETDVSESEEEDDDEVDDEDDDEDDEDMMK